MERELWVDKYSPKSFLELLSDEAVNRSVVKWLKSWDLCVFGSAPGAGSTAKQRGESRPEQKILLMSGAPGALRPIPLQQLQLSHAGIVAGMDSWSSQSFTALRLHTSSEERIGYATLILLQLV